MSSAEILNEKKRSRPKVSAYIATSIDGYIARKNGDLDWLQCVHTDDEDYGFKGFMSCIDTLILGRNTYEAVSEFNEWPYKDKRVIVLSKTLSFVRKEAELVCEEPQDLLSKLHFENIKHVWVDGGITISKFLEAELVDEMILSIIPIVLGSGIPLFNVTYKQHKCRLVSNQAYPSGLVQLKYQLIKDV